VEVPRGEPKQPQLTSNDPLGTNGCEYPYDIDVAVKFSSRKSLLDIAGLASLIARIAGLRSILVHRYIEININKLCEAAHETVLKQRLSSYSGLKA